MCSYSFRSGKIVITLSDPDLGVLATPGDLRFISIPAMLMIPLTSRKIIAKMLTFTGMLNASSKGVNIRHRHQTGMGFPKEPSS